MKYTHDALVIGLGPAGMAVSVMGASMGLKVCAVEKAHIGGECMNVGCIPSKALLRMAKRRHIVQELLPEGTDMPPLASPFERIAAHLAHIAEHKTRGMLDKVEVLLGQGAARFISPHEIQVGTRRLSGKRIFICTGTRPAVPDVPGLRDVQPLTNENLFQLTSVPRSLLVLGSGAIACEMAQAFARLGSRVSMVFRGKGLLWREERAVGATLEKCFEAEGITLVRNAAMQHFAKDDAGISLHLADGRILTAEKILCALGRSFEPEEMDLAAAGVDFHARGIVVDRFLRTSQRHIFACGDVNGERQFSHAAMHQGMLALMNCFLPFPFKRDFRRYPVPWTIFTEPQISRVGATTAMLEKAGTAHEVVEARYADYGAAIAEEIDTGFVQAAVSKWGNVLGVTIVGEGSGEMINQWATVMQNRLSLVRLLMQQHSFPTMGFLSKRIAEIWLMGKMRSNLVRNICRKLF
ncbi:MAG: FAD-dependent oxidoreductase [Desulfovibrio sp.]|nr:FAD-dependent oxidoreductase [Desulfovibrio sp.]